MNQRLMTSLSHASLELGEAAADAAVTISARLPIMARHLVLPSPEGWTEWATACSEKLEAVWTGASEAAAAWQAAMIGAAFSPPTLQGLACHTVDIMRAGTSPARACVRANALRLGAPAG